MSTRSAPSSTCSMCSRRCRRMRCRRMRCRRMLRTILSRPGGPGTRPSCARPANRSRHCTSHWRLPAQQLKSRQPPVCQRRCWRKHRRRKYGYQKRCCQSWQMLRTTLSRPDGLGTRPSCAQPASRCRRCTHHWFLLGHRRALGRSSAPRSTTRLPLLSTESLLSCSVPLSVYPCCCGSIAMRGRKLPPRLACACAQPRPAAQRPPASSCPPPVAVPVKASAARPVG